MLHPRNQVQNQNGRSERDGRFACLLGRGPQLRTTIRTAQFGIGRTTRPEIGLYGLLSALRPLEQSSASGGGGVGVGPRRGHNAELVGVGRSRCSVPRSEERRVGKEG